MSITRTITLFVLVACGNALQADDSDKEWERPITKVVNLLKDMAAQLDVEAKEDEEGFATMGCWCETNEKEKTAAIAEANRRIPELEATINEAAASTAQLTVEIEGLTKEVAENKKALDTAAGIRGKEHGDFKNREKELVFNIASGTRAVDALKKVHEGALLQGDAADEAVEVQKILKQHLAKNKKMLEQAQKLAKQQKNEFLSFLQVDGKTGVKAPPSAAIFGILKQMKEEFETTLADSRTDEAQATSDFEALKASKTKEIKAGEDQIKQKSEQKADAEELNAQSKEDHEDTSAQLEADTTFLNNLRGQCKNFAADYQERVKARTTEIQAVQETIGILTSDEASTAFSKSQSFLQIQSRTSRSGKMQSARVQANRVLRRAGIKFQAGPQATGAFEEVTKQIETMMAALKEEQKAENDKKDYCTAEFNSNEKETYDKNHIKTDLEAKIADLTALTESLNDAVASLKQEIADMLLEMKTASENREKENAAFQVTVADQKATQKILKKALDRLKEVYSAALLQNRGRQEPPVTAKAYSKNAGGSGVVAMVETIADDSKKVEADALKAENDAQAGYEEFIKDSNASIQAANDEIAAKTESLAQADADSTTAGGDLSHTIEDLLALGETAASLHKECDFLLKNFDTRKSKRTEEIEALMQAKYIFQGAGR